MVFACLFSASENDIGVFEFIAKKLKKKEGILIELEQTFKTVRNKYSSFNLTLESAD